MSQFAFARIAEAARKLILLMALPLLGCFALTVSSATAMAAQSVAFLGLQLQNDNEGLDPTSKAELARIEKTAKQFQDELQKSGKFTFVDISPELKAKIAGGQKLGSCSGCEAVYGREAKGDLVAWLEVQKISNLILNMNVYMADTQTGRFTKLHSVDIRGNTDESWQRSLTYLLNNYILNT